MRNVLFVGFLLPNGTNVYEKNLITELKKQTDNLEIISINKGYKKLEDTFQGIPLHAVKAYKRPVIDEITRFFYMIKLLAAWRKKKINADARIIMLNASIEINLAVLIVSKRYKIKVSSLLIDTALGNFKPDTLWNRYLYSCYSLGERLYKYLDGSIALNPRAFSHLGLLKKPTHLTKIGYSDCTDHLIPKSVHEKRIIVYTGSLMYYDGTEELLNAAAQLAGENIELHLYGSGPLREMAESFAKQHENIKYMGYLPNSRIQEVLSEADFLINPRISYFYTDIFGFPSKMIEYLLSGTPVITTNFSSMPKAYQDFVYLIKDESITGIKNAILTAINDEPGVRENKALSAYQYIKENNHYKCIVEEMLDFVFSI